MYYIVFISYDIGKRLNVILSNQKIISLPILLCVFDVHWSVIHLIKVIEFIRMRLKDPATLLFTPNHGQL